MESILRLGDIAWRNALAWIGAEPEKYEEVKAIVLEKRRRLIVDWKSDEIDLLIAWNGCVPQDVLEARPSTLAPNCQPQFRRNVIAAAKTVPPPPPPPTAAKAKATTVLVVGSAKPRVPAPKAQPPAPGAGNVAKWTAAPPPKAGAQPFLWHKFLEQTRPEIKPAF